MAIAKLLLPLTAAMALAASPCLAQTPAPAFDVASIHESKATDGRHHIYNDPSESHFRTVNVSLKELLQFAYNLPKSQILAGPSWLDSTMFDIDAKSDAPIDAQLHALPSSQARQQKQLMLQALLAGRFRLTTHQETRPLPAYSLVAAKGGAKFQPSDIGGTTIDSFRSRIHVAGSDNTVTLLAGELAQTLGRPVLDNTGIAGRYDLNLKWTPDDGPPPMLNGAPDPNAPPNIFTAIQEQLGLKLEPNKAPVPVLVVDHAELPSEN